MMQITVKPNQDIREARGTIPMWVIGLQLQVSETTLRRWMRREMSEDRRNKVLSAIKEIKVELRYFGVTKITKDSRPAV